MSLFLTDLRTAVWLIFLILYPNQTPQPNWRAFPPLQALKDLLVCRNKPEHKTGNTVIHTLRRGDDNDNNNQSNMILCKQTKIKTIKHVQTNINKQRFYKPILPRSTSPLNRYLGELQRPNPPRHVGDVDEHGRPKTFSMSDFLGVVCFCSMRIGFDNTLKGGKESYIGSMYGIFYLLPTLIP